jgi:hypothetical protein
MSRSSGGSNRVCFPCRIKYAGLISLKKLDNQTTVCSECANDLTLIPDYIETPKKQNLKAWKILQEKFLQKISLHPQSKHTDYSMLYSRISNNKERYDNQSRQITYLDKTYNNVIKKLFISITKKHQNVKDNKDKLWAFEISLKETIIEICKKSNPDLDLSNIEIKEKNYTIDLISFVSNYYYMKIKRNNK